MLAFIRIHHKRSKVVTGSEVIEQVSSFNYLGCSILYLIKQ